MQQTAKAIQAIVNSAASNGVNLLNGSQSGSLTFTLGIGSHLASLTTQSLADSNTQGILQTAQDANATGATNLMALTSSDVSASNIANTVLNIQSAITAVNGYATTIGSTQNAITSIAAFATAMSTHYSDIANSITAADTTTLSTKDLTLQAQIALSTEALSIANSISQYAVKLLGLQGPVAHPAPQAHSGSRALSSAIPSDRGYRTKILHPRSGPRLAPERNPARSLKPPGRLSDLLDDDDDFVATAGVLFRTDAVSVILVVLFQET